jgi:hypothetical protein
MKRNFLFFLFSLFFNISLYSQVICIGIFDNFDQAVIYEESFNPYLQLMSNLAVANKLQIKVQQSFRRVDGQITGNIVPPSDRSNHLVGHAIDINIVYNGVWYNASRLGNYSSLPQAIKNFITGCKNAGMRWGGDFSQSDPVHFDSGLNVKNRALYDKYFPVMQWMYVGEFENMEHR